MTDKKVESDCSQDVRCPDCKGTCTKLMDGYVCANSDCATSDVEQTTGRMGLFVNTPHHSGKSMLGVQLVMERLKRGGTAMFIDAESQGVELPVHYTAQRKRAGDAVKKEDPATMTIGDETCNVKRDCDGRLTTESELPPCPKCGESLYDDEDKDYYCMCVRVDTKSRWIRHVAENTPCRVCWGLPRWSTVGDRLECQDDTCPGYDVFCTPETWIANNTSTQESGKSEGPMGDVWALIVDGLAMVYELHATEEGARARLKKGLHIKKYPLYGTPHVPTHVWVNWTRGKVQVNPPKSNKGKQWYFVPVDGVVASRPTDGTVGEVWAPLNDIGHTAPRLFATAEAARAATGQSEFARIFVHGAPRPSESVKEVVRELRVAIKALVHDSVVDRLLEYLDRLEHTQESGVCDLDAEHDNISNTYHRKWMEAELRATVAEQERRDLLDRAEEYTRFRDRLVERAETAERERDEWQERVNIAEARVAELSERLDVQYHRAVTAEDTVKGLEAGRGQILQALDSATRKLAARAEVRQETMVALASPMPDVQLADSVTSDVLERARVHCCEAGKGIGRAECGPIRDTVVGLSEFLGWAEEVQQWRERVNLSLSIASAALKEYLDRISALEEARLDEANERREKAECTSQLFEAGSCRCLLCGEHEREHPPEQRSTGSADEEECDA